MIPLNPQRIARLIATLEDIDRAVDVSRVHIRSGTLPAAAEELNTAKASIGLAIRIARGRNGDHVELYPDDNDR